MIACWGTALLGWAAATAFVGFGTALALKRARGPKAGALASIPSARALGLAAARSLAPPPGPWQAFAASAQAAAAREVPGVSILKPVKGVEPELERCLESFFKLTYPRYELLFCVADADDPSIPLVERLIARHPRVRARLTIGAAEVGLNPKVNNMARSYASARYDWIWISDSNVRARPESLDVMAAEFGADVGVLTAAVAGVEARSFTGRMEAGFLSGYYARWMLLAEWAGLPVVVGKSMLFRRSQAERFGGIATLGRYLAEDYMAGKAMSLLGLRARVSQEPATQPIGAPTFASFWARHLRWGRIRRSQAPGAHALEFAIAALPSGMLGAFAAQALFGLPWFLGLAVHLGIWMACDALQIHALGGTFGPRDALAWVAREALAPALWAHTVSGRTVVWRGRRFALGRGGLLT